MFDKRLIPAHNPQLTQILSSIYSQTGASAEQKKAIEKRMEKIDSVLHEKLVKTITISEYFDDLWKQADLKLKHKEYVIQKLEAIQQKNKKDIFEGELRISKAPANLDAINSAFQMSAFEEYNYQEKLKNIKKKKQLDIESELFAQHPKDLDFLHSLNRPTRSISNITCPDSLHYTGGLCDTKEPEEVKHVKAERFVRKIAEEKKAFARKMQQIEESVERKELEELERYKKKQQEDEERRHREKKQRLEGHISELKSRSEARMKERAQWEEDYKVYQNKKPLFREMEEKYNKAFTLPEIEARNQRLQALKEFHKPISRDELFEHEKKVLKHLQNRRSEKREQSEEVSMSIQKSYYESRHHRTYIEELAKAKRQKEDEQTEQLKRKEKVMELLLDVRDKHLPKIDPQLEMQRMNEIEKLKKRKDGRLRLVAEQDEDSELPDPKKLGADYLKSVKELVQKIKKEHSKIGSTKEDLVTSKRIGSELGSERTKYTTKMTLNSTKSEADVLKRHNYLAELRKENKIQSSENYVEQIIKNKKLDEKEKKAILKSEVEKLEEKAKRKEMVRKYQKVRRPENVNHDEEDEVDQIYINSIKAKLELLAK